MLGPRFLGNTHVIAPCRYGILYGRPARSVARVRAQSTAPVRISVQREVGKRRRSSAYHEVPACKRAPGMHPSE
eukprot:833126-Pelagomonas_calceolata.AAC.11